VEKDVIVFLTITVVYIVILSGMALVEICWINFYRYTF